MVDLKKATFSATFPIMRWSQFPQSLNWVGSGSSSLKAVEAATWAFWAQFQEPCNFHWHPPGTLRPRHLNRSSIGLAALQRKPVRRAELPPSQPQNCEQSLFCARLLSRWCFLGWPICLRLPRICPLLPLVSHPKKPSVPLGHPICSTATETSQRDQNMQVSVGEKDMKWG